MKSEDGKVLIKDYYKVMSDNEFEKNEQGSFTYPTTAGNLKKGGYILIKDCPCKIVETSTCKP